MPFFRCACAVLLVCFCRPVGLCVLSFNCVCVPFFRCACAVLLVCFCHPVGLRVLSFYCCVCHSSVVPLPSCLCACVCRPFGLLLLSFCCVCAIHPLCLCRPVGVCECVCVCVCAVLLLCVCRSFVVHLILSTKRIVVKHQINTTACKTELTQVLCVEAQASDEESRSLSNHICTPFAMPLRCFGISPCVRPHVHRILLNLQTCVCVCACTQIRMHM